MKLPLAPMEYDTRDQAQLRKIIEDDSVNLLRRDRDAEIPIEVRLILTAPDGSRWSVTVDGGGNIGTEPA